MKLYDMKLSFTQILKDRPTTSMLILHHRAGAGDVQSIHREHLLQGWAGMGYHYYVRLNGVVYVGRPVRKIGSHCLRLNNVSIGICFEGNYEKINYMPETQKQAGVELVGALRKTFGNIPIFGHGEKYPTACPGRFFDLNFFKRL